MTRLYRFKSKHAGAHYATMPICDECITSREGVTEKGNPKFPGRGGTSPNSRLEKVADDAKGQECSHQWRVSGPVGMGWNEKAEEGKSN